MRKIFRVEGVDCGNCAARIERGIRALCGVEGCTFQFLTSKMTLQAPEERMDELVRQAEKIIRRIEPDAVLKKA